MAKVTYLEFEKPVAQLEEKIQELRDMSSGSEGLDLTSDINVLERKKVKLLKEIFNKLSPWEMSLLARHPNRPYTLDYINMIFTDFHELHGDRAYADDPSIVGGMARFNGEPVMVIGHQKGRDTRERTLRNFGMSRPEGYRKALRLMQTAEKFSMPIFTFVDTPGAYPGIGAEERGQSEAIGHNLYVMSRLKTPIVATVIGEGGSGGALAIAVADVVQMLQCSTYSVISPEGCASILWKSAAKAPDAAKALGLTAHQLLDVGLIDKILPEPLGGAHRDPEAMAQTLKRSLSDSLRTLKRMSTEELFEERYKETSQLRKICRSRKIVLQKRKLSAASQHVSGQRLKTPPDNCSCQPTGCRLHPVKNRSMWLSLSRAVWILPSFFTPPPSSRESLTAKSLRSTSTTDSQSTPTNGPNFAQNAPGNTA